MTSTSSENDNMEIIMNKSIENLRSFLDGFWREAENAQDRIVAAIEFIKNFHITSNCSLTSAASTDTANAKWRIKVAGIAEHILVVGEELADKYPTIDTDEFEQLRKSREGKTQMDIAIVDDVDDFPKTTRLYTLECGDDETDVRHSISVLKVVSDLKISIETFMSGYGSMKDVLIMKAQMLEFLDDEIVAQYEDQTILRLANCWTAELQGRCHCAG